MRSRGCSKWSSFSRKILSALVLMTSLDGKNLSAHIGPKPGNSQPGYLSNVGYKFNSLSKVTGLPIIEPTTSVLSASVTRCHKHLPNYVHNLALYKVIPSKNCQRHLKFCQFSEISPNLVA